jgi:hypothetical protein
VTSEVSIRNTLTEIGELDTQIKEMDDLIAELAWHIANVTQEQEAQHGHSVRSAATLAAIAPLRRELAEVESLRSRASHERQRYEYALLARANKVGTPLPELVATYVDLGEITARLADARIAGLVGDAEPYLEDGSDPKLLADMQKSIDAEKEKQAAKANERNEARSAAQKKLAKKYVGPKAHVEPHTDDDCAHCNQVKAQDEALSDPEGAAAVVEERFAAREPSASRFED